MEILGIDIGGSGIKGAPVDTVRGVLLAERKRTPTPNPSRPDKVAATVAELVEHFGWTGPVGVTFPAIVKDGVTLSAANVDKGWVGADARGLFAKATGLPVVVINDADAAGIAEMTFGAGRGRKGTVILLTFGTGIGSAIFVHGQLMPNTELGHLEIGGREAEKWASDLVRTDKGLSWKKWAKRVDAYLQLVEFLFSPDLIILGGGVSKQHEQFLHRLHTKTPVVAAQLLNDAGIVGAALAALSLV